MELLLQKHLKTLLSTFAILFSGYLLAINETENNGTFQSANQVAQGVSITGTIGNVGDADDYFMSVLANDGTLKFNFTFNSSTDQGDLFLYVYNKNSGLLDTKYLYNTGIGAGSDSLTIYCRQQDTIYYRFSSAGAFDYQIQYSCTPSGTLDAEPNNNFQTAVPFLQNTQTLGRIGYNSVSADPDDYFVTVLPEQGTFLYAITYNNTSGSTGADFFSYIYNKAGSLIATSYKYNQPLGASTDTIRVYCREADSLYVRIGSAGCFSYSFNYQVIPSGSPDIEPNNSFATATNILPTETTSGRIGYNSTSADPDDYFVTVLPNQGTFIYTVSYINTSGSTDADFFSYIYNKAGSLIGTSYKYNQPLGESSDTLFVHCREADTMYVRIGSSGCFSYSFNYQVIPSGTPDIEPNNSFASATTINSTETTSGRIGYNSTSADPDDYFVTVLPNQGTFKYTISYTNTSGSTDADFFSHIYNKAGSLIGNSYKYNQPLGESSDTIYVHCREADTMYVRISSNGCFSYSFNYESIASGTPDIEPNNSFVSATLVEENLAGRIGYNSTSSDNDDYFLSVLPQSGTLRLAVNYNNTSGDAGSDFYIYIYNKAGALIGNSYNYNQALGDHADTVHVYCLQADSVYFRISSSGCFSYSADYIIENTFNVDIEPNGSTAEAIPILLTNLLKGQIGHKSVATDADDYFSFTAEELVTINMLLVFDNTSNSTDADLYFYLYNQAGSLVWNKYYYNNAVGVTNDTLAINCLPAGNYKLRLSSSGCFNYKLNFDVSKQQPRANLNFSRFGNTFGFLSNAFRADSVSWNLGDGTTSDLNFPVREFGIGEYYITLTAFNQTCNIQDIDTAIINVDGIERYLPLKAGKGGEVGYFNIQIYGGGLSDLSIVELKKGGTTLSPFQIGSPSGAELNVLFSFFNAEVGIYDLKITVATGEVFEFPGGFEIFEDEPGFNITTEISGPSTVRTNLWTNYSINVHNDRARIASGVMAMIVLPRNVQTNFRDLYTPKTGKYVIKGEEWDRISLDMDDFENTYFQGSLDRFADSVVIDYDSIYSVIDTTFAIDIDSLYGEPYIGTLYPLYIPLITANGTHTFNFKLKSTSSGNLKVLSYAWPYNFRDNPISGQALEYIHEGGMQAAALAEYAPNPALRWVGRNAGKIDIGSQIAFTEFFDWYYDVNNADEAFYAEKGVEIGFEVAGELVPGNGDKSKASAKRYRDRIKSESEHLSLLNSSVRPPNKIMPGMASQISNRIEQYKEKIAQLGEFATDAEKYAAMDDLRNYLSKRGLSLTQEEIKDLLFSEDPKVNKPKDISEEDIRSITSTDPNAIYGNYGFAEQQFLSKDEILDYLVTFENVDTATAPAQIVRVELNLDPQKYDLSTFNLGNVTIAENTYFFRQNRNEFYRDIDLRPEKNIIVRINAQADTITGNVYWQFTSLEPETGLFLSDPFAGFLPPNVTFPEGEGSVSFSVKLKKNIAHNDSIQAQADIIFDDNDPILTNVWKNKIDAVAPSTTLNPQITVSNDSIMTLTYSGSDSGSGIKDYYLKAKINNDDWLSADFPMDGSGTYTILGSEGYTYSFYLFAIDSTGNSNRTSPVAQAIISLNPLDSNLEPEFDIYPNPNQGQLFVKSNGNYADTRMTIFNVFGQMTYNSLESFIQNQEKSFTLPELAQGVYMIRFENKAGKVKTKRFVYIPNN